jgi:hypothetical protein
MPRPCRPEYLPAMSLIRQCIAELGPELGPKKARTFYPKVEKSVWARWVRQVRDEDRDLYTASTALTSPLVPAPPADPPMLVGEVDDTGDQGFFEDQLSCMRADIALLHEYAAPRDQQTGIRRLRNPVMLVSVTRLRSAMLDLWVRNQSTIFNVDRMRELYNLIIEEVGKVSPDLQRVILVRLRELNQRRGLAMAAELVGAE